MPKKTRHWAKLVWKKCPVSNAQGPELAPFFGDLSQSEKLSEIKLPLKAQVFCLEILSQYH